MPNLYSRRTILVSGSAIFLAGCMEEDGENSPESQTADTETTENSLEGQPLDAEAVENADFSANIGDVTVKRDGQTKATATITSEVTNNRGKDLQYVSVELDIWATKFEVSVWNRTIWQSAEAIYQDSI